MMIRVAIADNDQQARNHLASLLLHFQQVKIVASSAEDELEQVIGNTAIDLIFCTPEWLLYAFPATHYKRPFKVITANDGFDAARAFEYRAFDYLPKPVSLPRLQQTFEFLRAELSAHVPVSALSRLNSQTNRFYIKEDGKFYWINLHDILYFESAGNYVKMHQKDLSTVFYSSLNYLAVKFPAHLFFRVNRSFLINLHHIRNIRQNRNGKLMITMDNDFSTELSQKQTIAFREQMKL